MRPAGDATVRAGESATEGYRTARRRRRLGVVLAAVAVAAVMVAVARPSAGSAAAALGLTVVAVAGRPRRDPQRWLRGAAGERATATLLEVLPARRWVVLHDRAVPGLAVNIDHLVIGPTGVWVVDSKAYRAPLRARWRSVWVGDRRLDTGPARWEADLVAERLGEEVVPIVAVHGTGLPRRGRCCAGVRVIPAPALVRRLRRGRRVLGRAAVIEVAGRADHLLPPRIPGSVHRR